MYEEKAHPFCSSESMSQQCDEHCSTPETSPNFEEHPVEEQADFPQEGKSTTQIKESIKESMPVCKRSFGFLSDIAPLFLIALWLFQSIPMISGRQANGLANLAVTIQEMLVESPKEINELPILPNIYNQISDGITESGILEHLSNLAPNLKPILPDMSHLGAALVTALSSLLLLLITWGLALMAGYGKDIALAAGCILGALISLAGFPPYAGSSLLSSSFIVASSMCLYSGWVHSFAPLRLALGFAFAACATLTTGIIGFILLLLTSIIFLIWRGGFRRARSYDGVLSFGLMLVILLGYIAYKILFQTVAGKEEVQTWIKTGFLNPISLIGGEWWILLPSIIILCLPLFLMIFFLPWEKSGNICKSFITNRQENPGHGWMWAFLMSSIITFCLFGIGKPVALLPILAPLAILMGHGILSLPPKRGSVFFVIISLILIFLGIAFAICGIYPLITGAIPAPLRPLYSVPHPGKIFFYEMLIQSGICLIFAFLIWQQRSSFTRCLIFMTIFAVSLALPLAWHPIAEYAPPSIEELKQV